MGVGTLEAPDQLIRIEKDGVKQKIIEEIRRFDVSALLKLLSQLGYKIRDIAFQSNPDLSSASSLCEGIIFSDEKYPRVTIIVNTGLLAANTPLPSFFRKKMESGEIDPLLFTRFLSFFDHFVLRNLFAMTMPEDNGWFFSDWEETRRQYLSLIALNSASTLAHLFQICFPELKVEVMKIPRLLSMNSLSATLGNTYLGKESFLGRNQHLTVSSFQIVLTAEEMKTEQLIAWPLEVKKRIREFLLHVLLKIEAYVTVVLKIKACEDVAFLSRESYLGYARLGKDSKPFQIFLFSGYAVDILKFMGLASLKGT